MLELNALQSERLEAALLRVLSCTAVRKTGKAGGGGVDFGAKLNAAGLADVQLFVQVKRYRATGIIGRAMVQQLRSANPTRGHGLFVTTSAFSPDAKQVAVQSGFPRIELIDGAQLERLVAVHASSLPQDLRKLLDFCDATG